MPKKKKTALLKIKRMTSRSRKNGKKRWARVKENYFQRSSILLFSWLAAEKLSQSCSGTRVQRSIKSIGTLGNMSTDKTFCSSFFIRFGSGWPQARKKKPDRGAAAEKQNQCPPGSAGLAFNVPMKIDTGYETVGTEGWQTMFYRQIALQRAREARLNSAEAVRQFESTQRRARSSTKTKQRRVSTKTPTNRRSE